MVHGEPLMTNSSNGAFLDICKQGLIQLKGANETGRIGFNTLTADSKPGPCVLKIESCPTCQIIIEAETTQNFTFYCQTGVPKLKHHCSLGCDYLYMFDVYYANETMHVIRSWNSTMRAFKSESSSVYVVLCHGPTNYWFTLKYRTVKKHQTIYGTASYSSAGFIYSPFFPASYSQNFETYEFIFKSTNNYDHITVSFDDWNLDSSSAFYFEESNIAGPVYGSVSRPNVLSRQNVMRVIFNTGQPMLSRGQRGNMGFKLKYTFINDAQRFRSPKTKCKGAGYLLDSSGGLIEFSKDTAPPEYYDCIWVIKTQPGYSGTYLKLLKKRIPKDMDPYKRNQIQIRSGLTSDGNLLSTIYPEISPNDYRAHYDELGFYIRINATVSSSEVVILAYASYKNTYDTDCKHDSTMFTCGNNRCINKSLVCNGYDHCGDNTDETAGCNDAGDTGMWDKSYQYTITIGVIVPMVISVFLIMVICLLFVMIRRCRRARLREAGMTERLQTLSEEVATRRGHRRRRRHRFFGSVEAESPPTYDEAIQNPPGWYDNVAFGTTVDPTLPQPPSYTEAIGEQSAPNVPPPGSPDSTDSSQSDMTERNENQVSSSSSSEGGSPWEIGRRQLRSRQRTDTSHISSSESETDETETSQSRNRTTTRTSTALLAGGSTTTSTNLSCDRRNNKESTSNDKRINTEMKDDYTDKSSHKEGDSYNCVIPDSNKVRSSRSMEVLPTLSLLGSPRCNGESEQRHEGHHGKTSNLRIGGPQSPKNGSCPHLSGSLTVYKEEFPSFQTSSSSTHLPQNQNQLRDRSEPIKNLNDLESSPFIADNTSSPMKDVESQSNTRSKNQAVTRENRYMPVNTEESGQSTGNVMVVYDGPSAAPLSTSQSPSRTPTYLIPYDVSQKDYHDSTGHVPSSRYNRDGKNQNYSSHQEQSRSRKNNQPHSSHINPNHNNENQRKAVGQGSDLKHNEPQNVRNDRRLAHLPIINQIRRTVGHSRSRQEDVNRYGNDRNQSRLDHHGNSRHTADQGQTGHYGNDRPTIKEDQPGSQENVLHHGQADQQRKDKNISIPNRTDRHGQSISRPDQTYTSPRHRGYSNNQIARRNMSENEEVPVVAVASGQASDGAIRDRQHSDRNLNSDLENTGYLNLHRSEEDDVYV